MIYWVYLFIASVLEVCWMYSLKYLDMKKIFNISWLHFFDNPLANLTTLFPLICYLGFGLTNVVFFSMATKHIPEATAFAVWVSLAIVGIKITEVSVFKGVLTWNQVVFMCLIVLGIVGLKMSS